MFFIKSHSQRVSPASQAIVAPHINSCRNSSDRAAADTTGCRSAEENKVGNRSSRFNPDLGLLQTFEADLSTSPGRGCRRPSPCVGPVGNRTHVDQVQVKRLNHYIKRFPEENTFYCRSARMACRQEAFCDSEPQELFRMYHLIISE